MQKLKKKKVDLERSEKEYETKKELREKEIPYQKSMAKAQAGVDALLLAGQIGYYLDLPEGFQETISFGVGALEVYKGTAIFSHAISTMGIAGLDPTGISMAIAGASLVINTLSSLFTEPQPTIEEVILKGVKEIIETQKFMLANQEEILAGLDDIKNAMNKNHREVMVKFSDIQKTLKDIQTEMSYGIDYLAYKVEQSDHNEVMREAKGFYRPYLDFDELIKALGLCHVFGDCELLEESFETEIESHMSRMFSYHEQLHRGSLMSNYKPVFFLKESSEIEKNTKNYLQKAPEFRVPVLNEMTKWINLHNTENLKLIDQSLPYVPQITNPYFQDELFFELVNVAVLWPKKQSESFLKLPYINEVCKSSQSVGEVSKIMRENLHLAWDIYWHYSNEMRKILDQDLRPYFDSVHGEYHVMQVQTKPESVPERKKVFKNNPELYFFSSTTNFCREGYKNNSTNCRRKLEKKAEHFKSCKGDVYTLEEGVISVKNSEIVRRNNCQPKENYNAQASTYVFVNMDHLGLTNNGKHKPYRYYPFYSLPQDTKMESYLKRAYRESVSDVKKNRLQSLDLWTREDKKPWWYLNDFIAWYKEHREQAKTLEEMALRLRSMEDLKKLAGRKALPFVDSASKPFEAVAQILEWRGVAPAVPQVLEFRDIEAPKDTYRGELYNWFDKIHTNSEHTSQHFEKLGLLDLFKRKNTLSYYISSEKIEIARQENAFRQAVLSGKWDPALISWGYFKKDKKHLK